MRKKQILHQPAPTSKSRSYTYTQITLENTREAWAYFNIGVNDIRGQLNFLSKEATRRDRERSNAAVNSPNSVKPPEAKLLNNAVRIVNAPRHLVEKAKAGDAAAQREVIGLYQEVLRSLEDTPWGSNGDGQPAAH